MNNIRSWIPKIWGHTQCIFAVSNVQVHFLNIEPGGYCSEHHHQSKFNMFYVIDGEVTIHTFGDVDEKITLVQDESTIVAPGKRHQFSSAGGCTLLEIYWAEVLPDDITRTTIGGIN